MFRVCRSLVADSCGAQFHSYTVAKNFCCDGCGYVVDAELIDSPRLMVFWLFLAHFGSIGRRNLPFWPCFGREKRGWESVQRL